MMSKMVNVGTKSEKPTMDTMRGMNVRRIEYVVFNVLSGFKVKVKF